MSWIVDELSLRKNFDSFVPKEWYIQEVQPGPQVCKVIAPHIVTHDHFMDAFRQVLIIKPLGFF